MKLENDTLTFAIVSDTQQDTVDTSIAEAVKTMRPDYILGCGDHNYPSGAEATWNRSIMSDLTAEIAARKVLFVPGNHDLDTLNGEAHFRHFRYPNTGRYFTVAEKNVRFICLNSGYNTAGAIVEPDGIEYDSKQGQWCKRTLEEATERFKFIFIHQSPWCSGVYREGRTLLRWPFKQWGASALFFGHEHIYQENYVDSFHYIGMPTGGGAIRLIDHELPEYCKYTWDIGYGFCFVTVDKFNAKIELFDINSTLIHTKILNG